MKNLFHLPSVESAGTYQSFILLHSENPEELERLFQRDRRLFTSAFDAIFPQIAEQPIAQSWQARLHPPAQPALFSNPTEAIFWGISVFLAGVLVKFPQWIGWNPELYLAKQLGYIIFPFILLFFAWKNRISFALLAASIVALFASAVYLHQLPGDLNTDPQALALLHMPLAVWALVGFIYCQSGRQTMDFLRFNGDWVVMSTLIGLASGLFLALTAGLFHLIRIDIEPIMERYILVWGLPAIPLMAAYLVESNPALVSKISPLIARIFTPFVLAMLVFFLIAVQISEYSIYDDREFLLLFNLVLLGVMALILFSLSDTARLNTWQIGLLLGLSVVTILANGMALSAILHRSMEGGFTPNRITVIGSNMLMFIHLILITRNLFFLVQGKGSSRNLDQSLRGFIPAIGLWALGVAIVFPLVFK